MKVHNGVLHVIYRHTAIGSLEAGVGSLWNALIGAIRRAKVHDGSPIVGEIVGKLAGGASSFTNKSTGLVHGFVERILCTVLSE